MGLVGLCALLVCPLGTLGHVGIFGQGFGAQKGIRGNQAISLRTTWKHSCPAGYWWPASSRARAGGSMTLAATPGCSRTHGLLTLTHTPSTGAPSSTMQA